MFRTEITNSVTPFGINLNTPILSMGSCFADEMGQRLLDSKMNVSVNPGGILFNPVSIFQLMSLALKEEHLPAWSFTEREGIQVNYLLHSEMGAYEPENLQEAIDALMEHLRHCLAKSEVIILTFGSAFVYKLRESGALVANCHKTPQKEFEKHLLSVEEIISAFEATKALIEAVNPKVNFLLTVSPVRHTKEGLPENNVSKSTLRLACHQLQASDSKVSYFPSYELMMDDLRDYRFYKKDLIHPNEQALDYIWDKFSNGYFDEATLKFIGQWSQIRAALNHRPFNEVSEAHQQFLKSTIRKLENFSGQVDVSEELAYLQAQLISS